MEQETFRSRWQVHRTKDAPPPGCSLGFYCAEMTSSDCWVIEVPSSLEHSEYSCKGQAASAPGWWKPSAGIGTKLPAAKR